MVARKHKKHRREFSPEYKRDIVRQANACKRGELAPLLVRERLTTSLLTHWRRALGRQQAAEDPAPAAPAVARVPIKQVPIEQVPIEQVRIKQVAAGDEDDLRDRIATWRHMIALAEEMIDAQKRFRELDAELERLDAMERLPAQD